MEPTLSNGHNHHGGGMTSSISSEDILSQSNHPNGKRNPFQTMKSSINGYGNALSISFSSNGGNTSFLNSSYSSSISSNSTNGNHTSPEIRVKSPHQFKPYRSSSSCVYCGENIGQVWIPFTSHSYKCSQCGIVCHKRCMELMNTISCSNKNKNSNNKKIRSGSTIGSSQSAPSLSVTMASSPNLNNNSPSSSRSSSPLSGSSAEIKPSPNSSPSSTSSSSSSSSSSSTIDKSIGNTTISPSMPSDERMIDSMFEALAKERGLPVDKLNWTKERKWLLITQHGQLHQETKTTESNGQLNGNDHSSPEYFINALRSEPSKELMLSLLVQLRSKTFSWLTSFIEMDGIHLIFNLLQSKKKETREECIRAIAIFMNSSHGLKSVTSLSFAAKRLAMVLTSQQFTLKSRAIVIELLTVMCMEKYVPGGYSMVLKALTNLKEKKRFTNFVRFIKENDSLEMKTKALCFINVLIHEPEETSVRVSIRSEFLRLGLYDYLKPLKPTLSPDENLYLQIEIFEEMMQEDNRELDHKLEEIKKKLGLDIESLDDVFRALKSGASKSGLTKPLLSILLNLLVLHSDSDGIKFWLLIDTLVRQITSQRNSLGSSDGSIDMKSLLQTVDAQTKEVTLTRKMEELEKQNIDKAAMIQEKDINIKQLLEIVKQIKQSGGDVSPDLQKQIDDAIKNIEVSSTSNAVAQIPEKVLDTIPPPPPPTPLIEDPAGAILTDTPGGGPPPPPPPPMSGGGGGGPPPPPPPPMKGKKNAPAGIKTRPAPKVPKPAHPLKALQWTKMPPAKVNESIFNTLGEMTDIHLPWQAIEQEYAAKVIVRKEKPLRKQGPMQVIDAKLGQNISIFLSQFKNIPVRDLVDAVQKQDDSRLNREQIKQMAKLLPSKDDMNALKDFLQVEDRSKLAMADQFCIDVGNFSFMGDKLALFQLRSEFNTRASELRPEIAAVSLACNELLKSRHLKRMFEIVLVLGNFINYGTVRGDQPGYKIDCLIKLADTKSADLQSNLIHTLVQYCEAKEPGLLAFADELPSLNVAKRVIWSGVVADLAMLSREYNLCRSIIDQFQKSNEPFCESMIPFLELAGIELDKLKKLQASTDENFKKLCIYLGEDSSKVTPDEIFELFARFGALFETALVLLQQIREQQEKEAKRDQQKMLRAELQQKLAGKIQLNGAGRAKKEDEEDIVNDLLIQVRDGDVFRKGRRSQLGGQASAASSPK